jgi:hypothetical protein
MNSMHVGRCNVPCLVLRAVCWTAAFAISSRGSAAVATNVGSCVQQKGTITWPLCRPVFLEGQVQGRASPSVKQERWSLQSGESGR